MSACCTVRRIQLIALNTEMIKANECLIQLQLAEETEHGIIGYPLQTTDVNSVRIGPLNKYLTVECLSSVSICHKCDRDEILLPEGSIWCTSAAHRLYQQQIDA